MTFTASGLSYGLVWSGSGLNFVFTVYTDRSSSVVLSPEFDNVEAMNYYQSIIDMKNVIYTGGTGTAAARTVAGVLLELSNPQAGAAASCSWRVQTVLTPRH